MIPIGWLYFSMYFEIWDWGLANFFWDHVIYILFTVLNFQNMYFQKWKVKIFLWKHLLLKIKSSYIRYWAGTNLQCVQKILYYVETSRRYSETIRTFLCKQHVARFCTAAEIYGHMWMRNIGSVLRPLQIPKLAFHAFFNASWSPKELWIR
jgi:hypothetical protein